MYGKKLKKIRNYFAATQDKMAEFLGITPRAYASYEREENNPPYSMLVSLCKNHDVNLNWFIADIGEMFNPPNSAETNKEWKKTFEMLENFQKNKNEQLNTAKSKFRSEVLQILKDEGLIK